MTYNWKYVVIYGLHCEWQDGALYISHIPQCVACMYVCMYIQLYAHPGISICIYISMDIPGFQIAHILLHITCMACPTTCSQVVGAIHSSRTLGVLQPFGFSRRGGTKKVSVCSRHCFTVPSHGSGERPVTASSYLLWAAAEPLAEEVRRTRCMRGRSGPGDEGEQ